MAEWLTIAAIAAALVYAYRAWTEGGAPKGEDASPRVPPSLGGSLTERDVRLLRRLALEAQSTTLDALLESHRHFDSAAAAYVDLLRSREPSEVHYQTEIRDLTRLRRHLRGAGSPSEWLASTRDLAHGALVTIELDRHTFATIVWFVNEDHFELRLVDPRASPKLAVGSVVAFRLVRPRSGVFNFSSTVRAVSETRPIQVAVEHTSAVTLDNRREYPREDTSLPIALTLPGRDAPVDAVMTDLSGGGMSFVMDEPLDPGSDLLVTVTLDPSRGKPCVLSATVIRSVPLPETVQQRVFARWNINTPTEREPILDHVFRLLLHRIRVDREFEHRFDPAAGDPRYPDATR